jgi:hypothetical protein
MTDHIYALTVSLSQETREDDAEAIINAILMIKGVKSVTTLVANPELYWAEERARSELIDKLWDVLYPKK